MSTATAPRRKRVKASDYPLPFAELPRSVQAKAVENWRGDDCFRQDNWQMVHEQLEEDLSEHYGITNCRLYASLNYCHGDGVAFEGNPDIEAWADHDDELREMLSQLRGFACLFGVDDLSLSCVIKHEGHYYHWNSMDVHLEGLQYDPHEVAVQFQEVLDTRANALELYLQEEVQRISRELEHDGYKSLEAYEEDEYVRDTLECNDHWKFDREGKLQ